MVKRKSLNHQEVILNKKKLEKKNDRISLGLLIIVSLSKFGTNKWRSSVMAFIVGGCLESFMAYQND